MGSLFGGADIPDAPAPAPVAAPPPPAAPNPEPIQNNDALNSDLANQANRTVRRRKAAVKGLSLLDTQDSGGKLLGG